MSKSVNYWLLADYKANPPTMAQDATPASVLRATMRKLTRRWLRQFDQVAEKLAAGFAKSTQGAADNTMMKMLKDAGFAVKFTQSAEMADAYSSVIGENASR